ncbi:TIR domain-containing protein [Carnobacterium mobile]|uniref:TIR domain-containing protein n=1 Tax=Carnobacterium mobile TaxID=2750 RepID=UPI000555FEB4|nr:TIR domain-containing protein [Carnobacterium mobile]
MAIRQVFFSFHFSNDVWRTGQIRNIGVVESQPIFSDNGWEKVRLKSDTSIKSWIDNEMKRRSCLVVLIGSETSSRKWVRYEIEQAWKQGKGIVGIYIHNLEDIEGKQSSKGDNPFKNFCIDKTFNYTAQHDLPADSNEIRLSSICSTYESSYQTSKYVYKDIKDNIEQLIEEAIQIRNRYPK